MGPVPSGDDSGAVPNSSALLYHGYHAVSCLQTWHRIPGNGAVLRGRFGSWVCSVTADQYWTMGVRALGAHSSWRIWDEIHGASYLPGCREPLLFSTGPTKRLWDVGLPVQPKPRQGEVYFEAESGSAGLG